MNNLMHDATFIVGLVSAKKGRYRLRSEASSEEGGKCGAFEDSQVGLWFYSLAVKYEHESDFNDQIWYFQTLGLI